MRTIFKYPINIFPNDNFIDMPVGSKILCVNTQNNQMFLWAEVNTENENVKRKIRIYGTGVNMDLEYSYYIGSVHISSIHGNFVWHVYDMGEFYL